MNDQSTIVLMNSEDLFALPDTEDRSQWLIRGELREDTMTRRNPAHSGATAALSHLIRTWSLQQPIPRGRVFDGEAYFRIRRDPDTNVGIDVAYASPELVASITPSSTFIDGPPVLAVEVLSPHDQQEHIDERIEEYLDCGVQQVWIVSPRQRTVTVYRRGVDPQLFAESAELSGDPALPGLRIRVREIFED